MTRPVSAALWESTPVPRSGMGLLIDPHLRTVNYDPITSFEPNRDARARTCAARKMSMQQNQPRLECCGAQTMAELVHLQPHRFGHRAEAMPPKPAAPAGRGRGGSGPIAEVSEPFVTHGNCDNFRDREPLRPGWRARGGGRKARLDEPTGRKRARDIRRLCAMMLED
jgi:hypothetical protein